MIIRLLMTAMILLAIAKFYLHDAKQQSETKPAQSIEDVQKKIDEFQEQNVDRNKKQLESIGL